MSEPSWRLGALATTAGLAVFAWALVAGGSRDVLAARVLAWPRSKAVAGGSYAVQVVAVGATLEPQARLHVQCGGEGLDTDESGTLLFSEPGALSERTCDTAQGPIAFAAERPRIGTETLAEPVRAHVVGVTVHGVVPDVFLEQPDLTVGAESAAWVQIARARSQGFVTDPEPGLEARVIARCEDGIVLGLTPRFHVTGLHLEWGAATVRERLDVPISVARGAQPVEVVRQPDGRRFAQLSGRRGWMGLFDASGLVSSVTPSDEPWPLPRIDRPALLVASAAMFDSSASQVRLADDANLSPCERARTLRERWPAPQPAELVDDGVTRAQATRRMQNARGKRTAGFGLAGGLVGLAAALFGSRNANVTARALTALAITLVLFGVLAMLLYAA